MPGRQSATSDDMETLARLRISALWASFMFLYIYVDYFHLLMPGSLTDLLSGRVFVFEVNEAFLLIGLISVTIPALMIPFTVGMPALVSRGGNFVVAALYIPYTVFNLVGEAWPHMIFGAVVEVALLLMIMTLAWSRPRPTR